MTTAPTPAPDAGPARWLAGARSAFAVTVDFDAEEVWIGEHPDNARRPGVLSQGTYGAKVGVLEVLHAFSPDVGGYRSPAWDFSPATMDVLREHGMRYSSNLMDDIRPYRHESGLVELPVQWILDDAPHFWFSNASWTKQIRSAREVLELWQEEAAGIHRLGGLVVLALHPQIIGRPGRIGMLEEFLRWVVGQGDVRTATCV